MPLRTGSPSLHFSGFTRLPSLRARHQPSGSDVELGGDLLYAPDSSGIITSLGDGLDIDVLYDIECSGFITSSR